MPNVLPSKAQPLCHGATPAFEDTLESYRQVINTQSASRHTTLRWRGEFRHHGLAVGEGGAVTIFGLVQKSNTTIISPN
ncbi:MAG: hypothetical protein V3V74_07500 [Nitrosomonadaceae bacterium]